MLKYKTEVALIQTAKKASTVKTSANIKALMLWKRK